MDDARMVELKNTELLDLAVKIVGQLDEQDVRQLMSLTSTEWENWCKRELGFAVGKRARDERLL